MVADCILFTEGMAEDQNLNLNLEDGAEGGGPGKTQFLRL